MRAHQKRAAIIAALISVVPVACGLHVSAASVLAAGQEASRVTYALPENTCAGLPVKRRVVVVRDDAVRDGGAAAWYNESTSRIYMRSSVLDYDTDDIYRVLYHEYGHALLDDVLTRGEPSVVGARSLYWRVSLCGRTDELPRDVPRDIAVIWDAYRDASTYTYVNSRHPGVSGTHFTKDFGEFFAESFARWLMHDKVDPKVAVAFDSLTKR